MKRFFVFASSFVDYNTGKLKIGGVETYIKDISKLAHGKGYEVTVYQMQPVQEEKCFHFDDFDVKFVNAHNPKDWQRIFDKVFMEFGENCNLYLIASDQFDIESKSAKVITIQHGIAFDIPASMITGFWGKNRFLNHINKMLRCIRNVQRFYMTRNTVCVDYNYYNWFRTLGSIYPEKKVKVIPNYCSQHITEEELKSKLANLKSEKKIVFARRFVDYRGTLLFANVIKRLFVVHPELDVTFAGDGPCKQQVVDMFHGDERVHFTSFTADESINFHKQFDISVVPTIFSEGTSLSLCEAMAAGCFPICTHVGGMTNIILDFFNGLSCAPTEDDLYNAIKEAVEMPVAEFNEIVINSYKTATRAFGLNHWRKSWSKFIDDISSLKI